MRMRRQNRMGNRSITGGKGMEERKIRGRSRRREVVKMQMRRPIAVLLALMLSFSSFGTATAYADDAAVVKESVDTAGTQEKVDLDKWMEKEVFGTGKQAENTAGKRYCWSAGWFYGSGCFWR